APAVSSFDEELEALLVDEESLVVSTATKSLTCPPGAWSKEAVIAPLIEQDLQRQDEFWQEVAKELEADAQQRIANSLEALAWEGLGLGEATGTGEGSWQGQGKEEDAKEKTPETVMTHYQPSGLSPNTRTQPQPQDSNPPQNNPHNRPGPGSLPSQPPQQPPAIIAHYCYQPPPPLASPQPSPP
ncbi:hypothetical protein C0993_000193, partial [Termitomyces sp. T159_Od127]